MSTTAKKGSHSLEDFAPFLRFLVGEAVPFSVIGGCAVGAYGRLRGVEVLSADLDVYTSAMDLYVVVDKVRRAGVPILKEPKARNLPVAVFEWEGKEVNVLSSSKGLPDPELVQRLAREFQFRSLPGLSVLVADPFDLLANKLAVNRPKDRPHIAVLRAFVEEEIVEAFEREEQPRKRIGPARRYLEITDVKALPEPLAGRLVPLARIATDYYFLANHVPTKALAQTVRTTAPDAARDQVNEILSRRRLRR
ncbi:MAG: hypothetical protein AB2A00_35610 [Myxococcota bacterium]